MHTTDLAAFARDRGLASPAVAFVGRHNSGKTTLVVKVIAELAARGVDVGSVKHHGHAGFDIDVPGKDSWRHREAGAGEVAVCSPDRLALVRELAAPMEASEVVGLMRPHDIVIVEGYRHSGVPTVEIMRSGNERDAAAATEFARAVAAGEPFAFDPAALGRDAALMPDGLTLGVASDIPMALEAARACGLAAFDLDDAAAIADWLLGCIGGPRPPVPAGPCGALTPYRIEHDSMGEVRVPAEHLWGAQTERSYENFRIGTETMPSEIIRAFAILKKAAARANARLGALDPSEADLVARAADEVLAGKLDGEFPLKVWQTGSGTQSNMNVNEVLARRANQLAGGGTAVHPNDTVNRSQSSNDTFPTALHIAAVLAVKERLIPAGRHLVATFERLEAENAGVLKSGRTHLQDAVPISFSEEISGWRGLVENAVGAIEGSLAGLYKLALGGTAVGTGLNAPDGFAEIVAEEVAALTGEPFVTDPNKFSALSGKDAAVVSHGAVKALAANMMKIANDVRWLASGPRLGLGEITIPANEPGSSIMPGKVNPTQCEAVTMVAVQVMGNDAAIGFAASQGNFELNVFMPVIAYNYLQSVRLLADCITSFDEHCASGIKANRERMSFNLEHSLMLVTCLNPYIGYENAAKVAKKAFAEGTSLKDACTALGLMTAERFDEVCKPEEMV